MACQLTSVWEAAQASASFAFICFSSIVGLSSYLVIQDHVEVSSLSCRMMLLARNPYPFHYRAAFAFSTFPYPQSYRLTLRLAFLSRGGDRKSVV